MKIKLFLFFAIAFFVFIFLKVNNNEKENVSSLVENNPSPTLSPLLLNSKDVNIEINYKKMVVSIVKVSDVSEIILLPNFTEKKSSSKILNDNKCNFLTNGGFYSKENKPLGLFIVNNKIISNKIQSFLFNGFFYVDIYKKAFIKREIPEDNYNFAIQSGPVLMDLGETLNFKINNDEEARRIVVAIDKEGNIFFIAVYNHDSNLQGPLLSELPEFIKKAGEKINANFETALNLDGGSASVFYSKNISLSEISVVGSFFCIK